MFRIENESNECTTRVRLSGRIRSDEIESIRTQMIEGCESVVLDLREVTLVDVAVVRFLSLCEEQGVELAHCPPYIREWILRERAERYN